MPVPPFEDLMGACVRSAVHLEMRDEYTPDDPVFQDWQAGKPIDAATSWGEWLDLVTSTTGRGVQVRRARIVSEPVTDFIRYEHYLTGPLNIAGGEDVRWLPRRRASDLALPGNDFWVFDDERVRFAYFAGDGRFVDEEMVDDERVVRSCATAFDAVWARAVPHEDYRLS